MRFLKHIGTQVWCQGLGWKKWFRWERKTGLEEGGDGEDEAGDETKWLWTSHLTAQSLRAHFFLCLAQTIVPWGRLVG